MIKAQIALFLTLFISTTASAHTGMAHSSLLHSLLHISVSVGIFAIILAGFYFYKRLPKAKAQRVRIKK